MQVRALRLVGGGLALAHHDANTFMISGALPNELVEVAVEGRRKGVVEARTRRVVADSHPARQLEVCPHAEVCGGCDWAHVHPARGAQLKATVAAQAARRHPELTRLLGDAKVHSSGLAYRLRARLHWDPARGALGFYHRRSWQVTAITSCRVISTTLRSSLARLHQILEARCPQPVDVEWLEDLAGDNVVVSLRPARTGPRCLPTEYLPPPDEVGGLAQGCALLGERGNRVAGWGDEQVTMKLPRLLSVPMGGFFQGNRHLVGWLFDRVVELAGPQPSPTWDLYAGVGLLAAAAAHAGERDLTLVESSAVAAAAARRNLPQARRVHTGTAESYLTGHTRLPERALVITDPPRGGMSSQALDRLIAWRPRRVLMLGCDPAPWARDAQRLLDTGYEIAHLELVDLFPLTHHVEVLALLERS